MTIHEVDMTGEPRSDEDLDEAISVCKEVAIKHTLAIPILTIHIMDIINQLEELKYIRGKLKEARAQRQKE